VHGSGVNRERLPGPHWWGASTAPSRRFELPREPVAVTHAYEAARRRFTTCVRDADPTATIPACPAWNVRELVAHQVHQLSGALDGSFPIVDAVDRLSAADASTRFAAAERQEAWIRSGVAEWRAQSAEVLNALVPDVVVHLLDLEAVTHTRDERDDALVALALEFWSSVAGASIPTGAKDRFELLRVITGRRSRSQAPGMAESVALYGWRETDLVE
jgi:hypothetical protein